VEDRRLPDQGVLLSLLTGALSVIEHGEHALARRSHRAEGTALDQRLGRLAIDRPAVHPGTEVPQGPEGATLVAGLLNRFDRLVADALDGVQAETDVALD